MKRHHLATELERILEDVVRQLTALLEDDNRIVCSMLWDREQEMWLVGPGTSAFPQPYPNALRDLAAHAGPWQRVRRDRQSAVIEDTRLAPEWRPLLWAGEQAGVRSLWSVPVEANGIFYGTLDVYGREPGPPSDNVRRLTEWAARYAEAAIGLAASRQSERLYRALFDVFPVMLFAADETGRFLCVNSAAERLTGYSREQLTGMTITQLPEEEDTPKLLDHLHETLRGQAQPVQIHLARPDGVSAVAELRVTPLVCDGQMLGLAGSLRPPEPPSPELERLRSALDIAGLAVWDWDVTQDQVYWSPAQYRILGIAPSDVPVSWDLLFGMVADEDRSRLRQALQACLQGESLDIRYRVRRPDGSTRTLCSIGQTVFGATGHPVRMIGVTQDITDQEAADEVLRRTERLAVVGQLAAGVAHELRNPLTTVKGFVHLLKVSPSDETRERYLDIIQAELRRIEQIINEFLLLGAPSGEPLAPCRLSVLVNDVVQLMSAEASLHQVELRLTFETEAAVVRCDAGRLKQVFVHVLKNAIEAMEGGGMVEVRLYTTGLEAVVEVRDHGRGIDNERLKTLGEPFYDTKAKGTGLGLMISRRILEAHGGRMEIESKLDEGTTVRVRLPLALDELPPDGPAPNLR